MGRIRPDEASKYQSFTGGEFFTLKNDGDTTIAYIMAETIDDLDTFVIHKVKDGDKTRNISCLRNAGDPVDYCPLCAAGVKVEVRIFVQLYDAIDKKLKVWDRGKSFLKALSPIARRTKQLYRNPIEIERNGAAGDSSTRYSLFPLEPDAEFPAMNPEDFPEPVEICSRDKSIVLERTYDELYDYLYNGAPLVIQQQDEAVPVVPQRGSLRTQASAPAPQQKRTTGVRPRGNRAY